jgi:hypothetical protein
VRLDFLTHLGGEILTRVVTERHIGALACEYFADCRTYASRSTGNERALSLKQQTHLAIFLLEIDGDFSYTPRLIKA